jgi:DNA-binding NarL/FixJ family response regulator
MPERHPHDRVAPNETRRQVRVVIDGPRGLARRGISAICEASEELVPVELGRDDDRAPLDDHVVLMLVSSANASAVEPSSHPTKNTLFVLESADDDLVRAALKAGAGGVVPYDIEVMELDAAVMVVATGATYVSPAFVPQIIDAYLRASVPFENDATASARYSTLTQREREVLDCIGDCQNNREIANALFIGLGTVKSHVRQILRKLELRDRVAVVAFAHRHGIALKAGSVASA